VKQQIQFVTAPDGVNLAVATMGSGPPLLIVPGWISHLELDWTWPQTHDLYERLARNHLLVRYDKRGTGLSDRDVSNYSLEAQVGDLDAIINALSLRGVALLGYSQGGPISIAYAVQHPDNVSHLVLYGSYHDGKNLQVREVVDAFMAMIRADWGGYGGAAMLEVFIPGAPPQAREIFAEYQRQAADAEGAVGNSIATLEYEITPLLPQVTTPTLVLHRRGDKACPFQQGREIAARIPGARFVPLEGDIHVISLGDTEALIGAIEEFLLGAEGPQARAKVGEGLQTILFTDMEGSTTLTQRLGDAGAQELLRTHNRIIRDALNMHGGTETKHTGDGVMVSFPFASRAIACAVAIQRRFASHNESSPDAPIRVRIGLNAGEPVAEDEDLFGTAVQLAARICAHAEPGQILASNVVQELAAGKGFAFTDRGEATLKGFDQPVRLYEVRWRQEG
jgi:class 3 adenylate cyclase